MLEIKMSHKKVSGNKIANKFLNPQGLEVNKYNKVTPHLGKEAE
jgi:hypothetical protein